MKTVISRYQMTILLFYIVVPTTVLSLPTFIFEQAGRDSWISVLLLFLYTLLLILLYERLLRRMGNTDLVHYSNQVLPKFFSLPFNFAVMLSFVFLAGSVTRETAEIIKSFYYTQSSIWLLNLAMLVTSAIIAYYGLEVMARVSTLYFYPYQFVFLLLFALIINKTDWGYLQPILGEGVQPVLKGVVPGLLFPSELFTALLFAPQLSQRKGVFKSLLAAALLSFFFIFIATITPILLFGIDFAEKMLFPIVVAFSYIERYAIIERMDSLYVFFWFGGAVFKVALFIYAASYLNQKLFKLSSNYIFIPPILIFSYLIATYYFETIVDLKLFLLNRANYLLIVMVAYPALLLMISYFRGGDRNKS